ncbi:hypothetical protein HQ550_04300, partial [bacterium]|nr:hypothetical protein [bacterium]
YALTVVLGAPGSRELLGEERAGHYLVDNKRIGGLATGLIQSVRDQAIREGLAYLLTFSPQNAQPLHERHGAYRLNKKLKIKNGRHRGIILPRDEKGVFVGHPARHAITMRYFIYGMILDGVIIFYRRALRLFYNFFNPFTIQQLSDKYKNYFGISSPIRQTAIPQEMAERIGRGPLFEAREDAIIIVDRKVIKWEMLVYNAATFRINGITYVLYRALGYDGVSRIGLWWSRNGIDEDGRLDYPIFAPEEEFEMPRNELERRKRVQMKRYKMLREVGGTEDPRITIIGDYLYMTYTAYGDLIRQAIVKIKTEDFLEGVEKFKTYEEWRNLWRGKGEGSIVADNEKDGAFFPERFNGKFVFLRRFAPNMQITFSDDLLFDGPPGKNDTFMVVRKGKWDSEKIGAGAPPMKTKYGWLHIYHGVDKVHGGLVDRLLSMRNFLFGPDMERGRFVYRLGLALSDLKDPQKVIYRSSYPILVPEEKYELFGLRKYWVSRVVFTCGAAPRYKDSTEILDRDDEILIYYGGADEVMCVALIKLSNHIPKEILDKHNINSSPVSDKDSSKSSKHTPQRDYKSKETFYAEEPKAKHYFELVVKLNLRLIDITARRIHNRELHRPIEDLDNIIAEIHKLISKIKPAAYPKNIWQDVNMRGQAKERLNRAIDLIKKRNEPAANAILASVAEGFASELIILMRSRMKRPRTKRRAGFEQKTNKFWVLQGKNIKHPISADDSTMFRVYGYRYYSLLCEAFRSIDHEADGGIVELLWLREIWKELFEINKRMDSSIGEISYTDKRKGMQPQLSQIEIEHIQNVLSQLRLKLDRAILGVKDIMRCSLDLALGLINIGEFRAARTILGVTLNFIEIRGLDVKNIIENTQKGRLNQLRMVAKWRNTELLNRINNILNALIKEDRNLAFVKIQGFLRAKRLTVCFNEPEFWSIKQPLGYAAQLIKKGDIKKAKEKLVSVKKKIEQAQILSQFMQGFRDLYVESNLGKQKLSKQDAFNMSFEYFIKKAGLNRGSPEADLWWTIFYRTAFLPLNINNPKDKTQRIPNPVFFAATDLISIKETEDFRFLIKVFSQKKKSKRRPVTTPGTSQLLKFLISEGKATFVSLSYLEQRELLAKLSLDYHLGKEEKEAFIAAAVRRGASKPSNGMDEIGLSSPLSTENPGSSPLISKKSRKHITIRRFLAPKFQHILSFIMMTAIF